MTPAQCSTTPSEASPSRNGNSTASIISTSEPSPTSCCQDSRTQSACDPSEKKSCETIQKHEASGETKNSITPTDKHEFLNLEEIRHLICVGNLEAKRLCSLWMVYVHSIDDLLDTREDGRPTMTAEQILKIPINAYLLFTNPFFVAHQNLLGSQVLSITNMYADSVQFEKSPKSHLRQIADVIRSCGNEFYFTIALICGGYEHMRKMSPLIRERSWVLDHQEEPCR